MNLKDLPRRIKGTYWIIKTNIRSSTLSAFSLTIALVLIVIVMTGPKTAADLLLEENLSEREFYLEGTLNPRNLMDLNYTYLKNLINLNDTVSDLIDEYEISEFLNNQNRPFLSLEFAFSNHTTENHTDLFLLKSYSPKLVEDIYSYSINDSKPPENVNETILIIPLDSPLNDSLGKTVHTANKISASINQFEFEYWVNISFKISGIIFFEDLPPGLQDTLTSSETHPFLLEEPVILLTSLENGFSFVSHSFSEIDPAIRDAIISIDFPPKFEISYMYYFNFKTLTYDESKQVLTNLENFGTSFASFRETSDFSFGGSSTLGRLGTEVSSVDQVTFFYLILSLPMVLISLMLVILSFGIVNYQRNQSIIQLKTRGMSKTWIFSAFLGEACILFVITFILSLLIGYPLSAIMSQSSSFFMFSEVSRELKLSVTDLWNIFLIDVGIFLLVYTKPIIDTTKLKIVEIVQPEAEIPFWQNHNIDIITLVIAFTIILIANPLVSLYIKNPSELQSIMSIISLLLIFSALFLLFGVVLVFSRIFDLILKKTSDYLWEARGGLFSLGLKNLVLNKKLTARVGVVVALSSCFLIIFATISVTAVRHQTNQIRYETGADITAAVDFDVNTTQLTHKIKQITGVKGLTFSINANFIYQKLNRTSNEDATAFYIQFIGIQENAAEVLYLKDYLPDNLVRQIGNFSNSSVLINSGLKEKIMTWIDVTDDFNLEYDNITSGRIESESLHLIGTYSYFPFFFTGEEDTLIGNYDFVKNYTLKRGFSKYFVQYRVFIKLDDNVNVDSVLSALEDIAGITTTEIQSSLRRIHNLENSVAMKIFWMVINSNVSAAIITIIISILLFTGTRIIVQSKENGLGRALGLKSAQSFRLHTIESFSILLSGGAIGSIAGLLVTNALLTLVNSFFTLPPLNLIVPTFQLFVIISIILIISTLFNILIIRYFDRTDISRLLKTI